VAFAATGRPPFGTGPAMAIMDRVRRGEHDLSAVPASLLPLVRACLAPDPRDRPETAAVLASLRAPARDDLTLPVVLATAPSATSSPTARTAQEPPRTTPYTTLAPAARQPARAPYMQPPEPRPRLVPPDGWRPPSSGLARMQRGALLLGLFATATLGFAAAPYLALLAGTLVTLAVRTVSWTTESARERQHLRGRRRWYDGPLTVASVPWYLVVATGGTVVLMLWSAFVAFVVGFAYLMFRGPLVPGLTLMGAVFAVSLWWGPASRRLRVPTRRLVLGATRSVWVGWLAVAVVAAAAVVCGYLLATRGVSWGPQSGAPWRSGTVLGTLARWL
jgi:hypothetical protein